MELFDSTRDSIIRRLQLETQARLRSIAAQNVGSRPNPNDVPVATANTDLPPITQLLRNTDVSHSVNTWYDAAPVAGDIGKETAEIYTHSSPNTGKVVFDGAITAGTNAFSSVTGGFVLGDVGKNIVIDGAGTGGRRHATTIAGFTDANNITITANAITTVTGNRTRWGMVRLNRTNKKNSAAVTTDSLKSVTHSQIAANIADPDWNIPTGEIRLGSTNTLTCFLGTYNAAGTVFNPQHYGIQAQREMWFIARIAKVSANVAIFGHFFAGLWDNSTTGGEWLTGQSFMVNAVVDGTPAATATTQYMIEARTDRGYTYFSNVFSLPNAPTEGSYIAGSVRNFLEWSPAIPATLQYIVYRKIGAGNVFQIASTNSIRYTDNNPTNKIDLGTGVFPATTVDNQIKSYVATLLNGLDETGVATVGWSSLRLAIPMPPNTQLAEVQEIAVRFGLTQPLGLQVFDGVTTVSSNTVTSIAALFRVDMVGKLAHLVDSTNPSNAFTATVSTFVSATEIQLSAVAPYSSGQNTVVIEDSYPHGLLIDLIGLSFTEGVWAIHPEDNTRLQLPTALPNSGTGVTGGPTGGGPTGGGGIDCIEALSVVIEYTSLKPFLATETKNGDWLYNGTQRPSRVKKVRHAIVYEAYQITMKNGDVMPLLTKHHRTVRNLLEIEQGFSVNKLSDKDTKLIFAENSFKISEVESVLLVTIPEGLPVVAFEMETTLNDRFDQTFLLQAKNSDNFYLEHNRKVDIDPIIVF
jgi:hypothetical protein